MNQHQQDSVIDAAKTARQNLKEDNLSADLAAKVARQLANQDDRLGTLEKRVKQLAWENRQGGGFPWGLLILAEGAYAAYRFVPAVQKQVNRLIGQADPGVEGDLNRAGGDAKDAVQAGLQGEDPRSAAKAAVGEVKRAGEKMGDSVKDRAEGLADRLKD